MILPSRPEHFNILPPDSLKKISQLQLVQMLAQEAMLSAKEDYAVANNRARCFMKDFYSGKKDVRCKCGKVIQFKNGKLLCPECGRDCDTVEYIEDFKDRFIKTVIDVKNQTYSLMEDET